MYRLSPLTKFFIFLSVTLTFYEVVVSKEGFCSAPTSVSDGEKSAALYWKVTNPTLAPVHLEDLPGFTRSVYKRDHALITPESHVLSPLPEWKNALGAYLITPAMGSHFVMYIAKMQDNSRSVLPPADVERFVFVVDGVVSLTNGLDTMHNLMVFTKSWFPKKGFVLRRLLFPMEKSRQLCTDLPGFTRSVYKRDHVVITPESHVLSPLPEWKNALGAYLITPAMGSHFVVYIAKMQDNSRSALPPAEVERFVFVVDGVVSLTNESDTMHNLMVDSYAYMPPNFQHSIESVVSATVVVFERRYSYLGDHIPELKIGSTDRQELLETPGEIFQLRKLLPTTMAYDFNIHTMDFQPGEFLNVKDVHYNQHGLLLLEGQGIYRLSDNWYPVQAGDAIWMAPFVPQWYAALGKSRTRYLLYKDVNRNPVY